MGKIDINEWCCQYCKESLANQIAFSPAQYAKELIFLCKHCGSKNTFELKWNEPETVTWKNITKKIKAFERNVNMREVENGICRKIRG